MLRMASFSKVRTENSLAHQVQAWQEWMFLGVHRKVGTKDRREGDPGQQLLCPHFGTWFYLPLVAFWATCVMKFIYCGVPHNPKFGIVTSKGIKADNSHEWDTVLCNVGCPSVCCRREAPATPEVSSYRTHTENHNLCSFPCIYTQGFNCCHLKVCFLLPDSPMWSFNEYSLNIVLKYDIFLALNYLC